MIGQPPLLYLEALRQAAALRFAVTPTYSVYHDFFPVPSAPIAGPVIMQQMLGNGGVIDFIATVANGPKYNSCRDPITFNIAYGGWIAPSNQLDDYSGLTVPDTEWEAESIIGEELISTNGFISGIDWLSAKWLCQMQALLKVMTVSAGYWDVAPSGMPGTEPLKEDVCYTKEATANGFAAAMAALDAESFLEDSETGLYHYAVATGESGDVVGARKAMQIRWRPVKLPSVPDHPSADIYMLGRRVAPGGMYIDYVNNDYPSIPWNSLGLLHSGIDLTTSANTEWIGKIDAHSLTYADSGWGINGFVVVCDWSSVWALGA